MIGAVRNILPLAVALCVLGCTSRTDVWVDDESVDPSTWGGYSATLDIPECPSGNLVLTVNTTADELDGGEGIASHSEAGAQLSLHEALTIAVNRGHDTTIVFDASVFPAEQPQTLTGGPAAATQILENTCLDARRRGVVLRDYGMPTVGDGTLVVGLTIVDLSMWLSIDGGQVAGCRLGTDGQQTLGTLGDTYEEVVYVASGTLGPANVIANRLYGVRFSSGVQAAQVQGNDFGFDPVTLTRLDLGACVVINGGGPMSPPIDIQLRDNSFLCRLRIEYRRGFEFFGQVVFDGNFIGVHRDGRFACSDCPGLSFVGGHYLVRGNTIHGLQGAAIASDDLSGYGAIYVEIRRNSISGNGAGIRFEAHYASPPLPPVITAATPSDVRGTCPEAGTIEVFSDTGDQGEDFLGTTACDGVTEWVLQASVPSSRNVTATLTVEIDAISRRTGPFSAPVAVP